MQVKEFFDYVVITLLTGTKFPRVYIHLIEPNLLHIKSNWMNYGLNFEGGLKWPGTINIDINGVVTTVFEKEIPCNWKTSYVPVLNTQILRIPVDWVAEIDDKRYELKDTCILGAKFVDKVFFTFAVGTWIYIKGLLTDLNKSRYYFLVPKQPLVSLSDPNPYLGMNYSTINNVTFMVKANKGYLSQYLFNRTQGDKIRILREDGNLDLELVAKKTKVYLLASGIGIAPMASIALRLLQVTNDTKVHIVYFNFMKGRILFLEYFNRLKQLDKRFNVTFTLGLPRRGWTGPVGFIDKKLLVNHCGAQNYSVAGSSVYFVIAGAYHFVLKSMRLVQHELGYPPDSLYTYLGR